MKSPQLTDVRNAALRQYLLDTEKTALPDYPVVLPARFCDPTCAVCGQGMDVGDRRAFDQNYRQQHPPGTCKDPASYLKMLHSRPKRVAPGTSPPFTLP